MSKRLIISLWLLITLVFSYQVVFASDDPKPVTLKEMKVFISNKTNCRGYDDYYQKEDAYKNICNCMREEAKIMHEFQYKWDELSGGVYGEYVGHKVKIQGKEEKKGNITIDASNIEIPRPVLVQSVVMTYLYKICQRKVDV